MGLYQEYETDVQAENEGVYHTFKGGFKLRLARAGGGNIAYMKALADRADQLQNMTRQELAQSGFMAEIYAEAVVTAIEDPDGNFVDREGEAIEVGSEALVKAFRDLPEFWLECQTYATDKEYYRPLDEETTAKK